MLAGKPKTVPEKVRNLLWQYWGGRNLSNYDRNLIAEKGRGHVFFFFGSFAC